MKKIYKEKGFTLIELLATIVILLLVFTIGFTVISNLLSSSNDTIDDVTKKMIIKAAEQYAIEYRNEESWGEEKDDDGNTILCITLESLINSGYFGANQSKVMEYKNDGWTVKITINNGIYNSEIITSEIADNVCKNFNGKVVYTINYDANGGDWHPESQTKIHNKLLTLSSDIPEREGHIFLGWSTSSSATSATYNPGDSYTANSSATLYAVWKKITYTVKYYANGGSGQPSSQTKFYDTALKLSSTIPQRAGYEFLGWSTSSDAPSATYSPGQTYTNNAHINLYAVWKKIIYTISYNANGGSGQPVSQTKNYDVNIVLSNKLPKRAGYLFLGWSTSSSATSATYNPGDSYTANSSATLYAVWKAVPVGAYISYTAGGYSSWRVMYNNNGQLDIISTGSVGNRSLANEDGYKNGVGYLNSWAKEYINSEYATTARCLGYSSATQEYVTATFDYDSTGFPHEESNYQTDVNQLRNYGLVQTDTTVFLASRTIQGYRDNIFTGDFGTQGRIRVLLTSGENDSDWLHESAFNHDYDDNRTRTYGLRPVVSLASGLYVVSGDGTSESTAYVLSK